jgi:hypothetical protein
MSKLKILKVKDLIEKDNRFDKLNPILLKPPFLLVINGSVRSGKSNLIINFLYNNNFYKNIFDNIVYISPTVNLDNTLQHLDEDIVKVDNPELMDETLMKIVENQEDNKKEHTLIIIDDCLGFIKRGSYLTYLATRYRHFRISLLITSQDYKSIPNIVRANASGYIIFKTSNKKEYKKLEDEFGSLFENFKELYEMCTNKLYSFMFINLRNLNVYSDFEKLVYDKSQDLDEDDKKKLLESFYKKSNKVTNENI